MPDSNPRTAAASPQEHAGTNPRESTSILVVVPAFNESESISQVIEGLHEVAALLQPRGINLQVCVIDDGSVDGTGDLAEEAGADRVIRHAVNQGLGAAVRSGFHAAQAGAHDIAVKFDADLQHDPRDIPPLIAPLLSDEADVVYGNRFADLRYRMPLIRRLGNRVFSRLMSWLTGWPIPDSQPGILAVNRRYLRSFQIPGDYNYTQQVLLEAYHQHLRFAHVPVTFRERTTGKSFVSFRYPLKVLPQIVLVIASIRPLRVFFPIGLAFLLLATLVFCYQVGTWLMDPTGRPVENVNLVLGSALFGLQTVFFGVLAELIVQSRRRNDS